MSEIVRYMEQVAALKAENAKLREEIKAHHHDGELCAVCLRQYWSEREALASTEAKP